MTITKTFADDTDGRCGGTHTFELVVTNTGVSDADNVTIVDAAPAGLTFVSEDSANCAIEAGDLALVRTPRGRQHGHHHRHLRRALHDQQRDRHQHGSVTSDEDTDSDGDSVVVAEDVQLDDHQDLRR